jgi:hypothetical protein
MLNLLALCNGVTQLSIWTLNTEFASMSELLHLARILSLIGIQLICVWTMVSQSMALDVLVSLKYFSFYDRPTIITTKLVFLQKEKTSTLMEGIIFVRQVSNCQVV